MFRFNERFQQMLNRNPNIKKRGARLFPEKRIIQLKLPITMMKNTYDFLFAMHLARLLLREKVESFHNRPTFDLREKVENIS